MKVTTSGGPHDGRDWSYPSPPPESLMCYDPATGYHEYAHTGRWERNRAVYTHLGWAGRLPLPTELDEEKEGSA